MVNAKTFVFQSYRFIYIFLLFIDKLLILTPLVILLMQDGAYCFAGGTELQNSFLFEIWVFKKGMHLFYPTQFPPP